MNRGWMVKLMVLVAIALVALAAPAAAQQSELGGKVRRAGREVVIPAGETVQGDLIATAGTVRVDGRVDGDLVASGGQVIVAGTVTGDALVGAGSTTISGEVGGDLRAGAGQARIEGRVGEDVLLGAGQATVAPESRIAGDLIVAANQKITQDWRSSRKAEFELFISRLVVQECRGGDSEAAARRMALLANLPQLAGC